MYERTRITGMPCDTEHPFPAPSQGEWADSMEYGDERRQLVNGKPTMNDRSTVPAWRAVAANLWGTDCYEQHLDEVAADPIMTTYLIATSALASPPEHADMIIKLAFAQAGAGQVFAALNSGGLEGGRSAVDQMHPNVRKTALMECVAHINHGYTALRLDVGARFHS